MELYLVSIVNFCNNKNKKQTNKTKQHVSNLLPYYFRSGVVHAEN